MSVIWQKANRKVRLPRLRSGEIFHLPADGPGPEPVGLKERPAFPGESRIGDADPDLVVELGRPGIEICRAGERDPADDRKLGLEDLRLVLGDLHPAG